MFQVMATRTEGLRVEFKYFIIHRVVMPSVFFFSPSPMSVQLELPWHLSAYPILLIEPPV